MMSQDYTYRLHGLAEEFRREAGRIEVVGRALTDAEMRRVDALRQAGTLVEQALQALASAPPLHDKQSDSMYEDGDRGGVMRGDVDETDSDHPHGGHDRSGPMDNAGLAGDDNTPGYGRGGRGGRVRG